MGYFTDTGFLILFCLLSLFQVKPDMGYVAAVLCGVALVCGNYGNREKHVRTFLSVLYGVLGLWNRDICFFYPLLMYCSLENRVPFVGIIFSLIGCSLVNAESGIMQGMILLAGMGIAFLLQRNTERYGRLLGEFKKIRDDSEERNLLLSEKNKMLQEKQDYEIYAATLKERNRIAREIHDNVGHVLSRSILLVGAAKTVNKDEKMLPVLDSLDQSLNSAMNSIRNSVHDLHDEAVNLKEVVQSLVKEFEFCPVKVDYDVQEGMPKEVKYCFISVIKEALSNVIRHSNATEVTITIREHPALYQLCIDDNGTQKPDVKKGTEGIGIVNMRERVKSLQGNFQVNTKSGFRVFITVPKNK